MSELTLTLSPAMLDYLRQAAGRDGYGDDVAAWCEWMVLAEAGWWAGHTVEPTCKCASCVTEQAADDRLRLQQRIQREGTE